MIRGGSDPRPEDSGLASGSSVCGLPRTVAENKGIMDGGMGLMFGRDVWYTYGTYKLVRCANYMLHGSCAALTGIDILSVPVISVGC